MKKTVAIILLITSTHIIFSQEVYHHIKNINIYEFLDEMASMKLVDINSAIKPFSRKFIADKLKEIEGKKDNLNKRQQKELDFYLKNFNKELKPDKNFSKRKDLFYYKDSLFTLTVNPILGINYFINENGTISHRWNGAEAFAYIGKHWGCYTNLRDNNEKELLETPDFFTQRTGAKYKSHRDYSEMRGGITYSWDWGSFGLIKEHFIWGNNYNGSNIFSGRTPSFAHIKLHVYPVKWFDFNYMHGWLASEIVDSNRTYNYGNGTREVLFQKYIAANMFTFTPFKQLNISFGNSIVYSDMDVHPAFLIPVFFYKSIDHTINTSNLSGQNSQMFFDISSRQIKNVHLYTSFYIDEVSFSRMWDKNEHTNFISGKLGFCLSNLPVKNVFFITEYTRTNPMAYQHFIPTTTFETNNFNLGHYLRDNSQETFLCLKLKPISKLHITFSYTHAEHGDDYVYGTIYSRGIPFMQHKTWNNETYSIKVNYEIINDAFVFAEYFYGNITGNVAKYTPEFFYGKTNTISTGLHIGF